MWTTTVSWSFNSNGSPVSSLDLNSGVASSWKFLPGNFTGIGNAKDELLIIQPVTGGSDAFWVLLSDLDDPGGTPTVVSSLSYPAGTFGVGTTIGQAHLNADFYTANLAGDAHDELFSDQIINGVQAWHVTTFFTPGSSATNWYSGSSVGNWTHFSGSVDKYHFANFDQTTPYDELFSYQRNGGWAMIQSFSASTPGYFSVIFDNSGSGNLYFPNQCNVPNYNVGWNIDTQFFFGNWDNCDQDIEGVLIDAYNPGQCASFEFNSSQQMFKCWSLKWPDLQNRTALYNYDNVSDGCGSMEMWSTKRECCGWALGIEGGVCIKFCGGNQHMTPRTFPVHSIKDGELQFYMGNFYNNTSNSNFDIATQDLMIFRNETIHPVPPALCNTNIFLTSIPSGGMGGDQIPEDGWINMFAMDGKLIAIYNVNTTMFSNTPTQKNSWATIYSQTDNDENMRQISPAADITSPLTGSAETVQSEVIGSAEVAITKNNKGSRAMPEEIVLAVKPNPATDLISIDIYTQIDLASSVVTILNTEGKIMENFTYSFKAGYSGAEINVSRFTNGLYIVKMQTRDNGTFTTKFIKN